MTDIDKTLCLFRGVSSRDPGLATRYINPESYVEHDPRVGDGVEGVKEYISQIAAENPDMTVVRAYQDGPYVFTQADGHVQGNGTFFDVFRFENGLIVEHWGFAAQAGPPNESGHTQIDGPTEADPAEDTQANKALVRDYYEAVHINGRYDAIPRFFSENRCVRHEPGVADGLDAFMRDLAVVTRHRTIDEIKLLLGQAGFVFIAAQGTHQSEPCVYIDLYRVENEKIVEHWGFFQDVPPQAECKNRNGIL